MLDKGYNRIKLDHWMQEELTKSNENKNNNQQFIEKVWVVKHYFLFTEGGWNSSKTILCKGLK